MGNSMDHDDHRGYRAFAAPSRIDKALTSLLGIVEGIEIDRQVNQAEVDYLNGWLDDIADISHRHPLNEFVATVRSALDDGILTEDERDDIRWLYNKLTDSAYYDMTTSKIQELHGILAGILADGVVTEREAEGLEDWLESNRDLQSIWPYDEINAVVTQVMADRKIDPDEQALLTSMFTEFAIRDGQKVVGTLPASIDGTIQALVAVDATIEFSSRRFCFTGASSRYGRKQLAEVVESLGGEFSRSLSQKVDYLVVGSDGNPCWAFACYGRKVEQAVKLRREGHRVLIIHEFDFHDAVLDHQ